MPVYFYFDLQIGYQAYLEIWPDDSANVSIRDHDGKKYYLHETIFSERIKIFGFDLDSLTIDFLNDNHRYRSHLNVVLDD